MNVPSFQRSTETTIDLYTVRTFHRLTIRLFHRFIETSIHRKNVSPNEQTTFVIIDSNLIDVFL